MKKNGEFSKFPVLFSSFPLTFPLKGRTIPRGQNQPLEEGMAKVKIDMTEGKILPLLIRFALSVFFGSTQYSFGSVTP